MADKYKPTKISKDDVFLNKILDSHVKKCKKIFRKNKAAHYFVYAITKKNYVLLHEIPLGKSHLIGFVKGTEHTILYLKKKDSRD